MPGLLVAVRRCASLSIVLAMLSDKLLQKYNKLTASDLNGIMSLPRFISNTGLQNKAKDLI